MKINLKKDRGILPPQTFLSHDSSTSELSEDERIAETMRRRHSSHNSDTDKDENLESQAASTKRKSKIGKKKKTSNRKPLREFLLLILMLSTLAYYMNDKGILLSSIDMAKDYIYELIGINPVLPVVEDDEIDRYDKYFSGDTLMVDDVLPDKLFDELMPVTADIAALADSIASLKPDSLYVKLPGGRDTVIVYQEYSQVAEEIVDLSDDDIAIINNRSLLIMVIEMISNFPVDYGSGHLYLKRDALTITAPRGGEWVGEMHNTLDKFVQGSFIEDYSTGTARVTSKFELIMNAETDFQGQSFDAMKLLDVLANPYDDYLDEIVIDPSRGTNDNPAQFLFTGSAQEIQYILSSWAESRSNYLIRSIDIVFQGEKLLLKVETTFFNYTP